MYKMCSKQIVPRIANYRKKIYISTFWNVIRKSMRSFRKCHKVSESLKQKKIKENKEILLRANFFIWVYWPKIGKVHISSVLLTFLCSMRPFQKCHIISKILVKISLKFHPFAGDLELISRFESTGNKTEKSGHKLRSCSLFGMLNTLLAFSYPGETDYDKKYYFQGKARFYRF